MADEEMSGVVIVPNELVAQVTEYAAKLADEQAGDVEGFTFRPQMGLDRMGSLLGRPSVGAVGRPVNMLSGSGCQGTPLSGGTPTDFQCMDDD